MPATGDHSDGARLSEQRVGQIVASQLPTLHGLPISRAGEGYNHEVFAAGDSWLVRFPKSADWRENEASVAVG